MTYVAAGDRYSKIPYRRCGRSGIMLPEVSLGLWQNFGDEKPLEDQRAILRRAFDLGVTHFDLANNYGPPYGSAEINFGRIMREDLRPYRDELIISTKAGYDMWPGPYGDHGSRKYLLASLDQSLRRMGLEYVDIFYSHRFDPDTPLEETMGALDTAVRSGKALYAGISSYSAERTLDAISLLRRMGTPLLIHQPSYSMLNRWIEGGLLDVLGREGVGCIAFSPLAQGVLTGKYLGGVPAGSRAAQNGSLSSDQISERTLAHVRALAEIAAARGQSLAQLALSWALRDQRVTSVLIGASSVAQLEENLAAADHTSFTDDELAAIDRDAGRRPASTSGPTPAPTEHPSMPPRAAQLPPATRPTTPASPTALVRPRPLPGSSPEQRLPNAMKPDIHGVRTHWIRGFMAFQRAAAFVQLQMWPEITPWLRCFRPAGAVPAGSMAHRAGKNMTNGTSTQSGRPGRRGVAGGGGGCWGWGGAGIRRLGSGRTR